MTLANPESSINQFDAAMGVVLYESQKSIDRTTGITLTPEESDRRTKASQRDLAALRAMLRALFG